MERLIVLDTETTGIDPKEGHRIIEVGAVQIDNREITNIEFHKYIQPNRTVGDSVRVHGITDKFLINKPQFSQISDDLISFIEGSTLIIHNAPFDLGFLNHEFKLNGVKIKVEDLCQVIDTLELSKEQRPGTMHNLDALCRRFGIDTSARTRHAALLDAQILAKVYIAMTGGQSNLFQETHNNEPQIISSSVINKNQSNKEKIKVVFANKTETELHHNYFKK